MPSPFRSSASIKTESAYGDETADEVENENEPDVEASVVVAAAAAAAAADSEPNDDDDDDLALVASDLVPPPPEATARRSTTASHDAHEGRDSSKVTGNAAPRCEICKKQKQRVSKQLVNHP